MSLEKLVFRDGNSNEKISTLIDSSLKSNIPVIVDFGHIGGMVINATSDQAHKKIIELKSMGGKKRKGPLSCLISVHKADIYDLIDYVRLSKTLGLKPQEKTKMKNILETFDGLAFKRIPLNTNSTSFIPNYLVEYTYTGPSFQFFSFLGAPQKLVELFEGKLEKVNNFAKPNISILAVTSLNFSGQKSASSEEEIETVAKAMGYNTYISVEDHSNYRSGSFPIIDFTESTGSGVRLVREGNLHYYVLKLLYPNLKNSCKSTFNNFLDKFQLDATTKDIIYMAKHALKRIRTEDQEKRSTLLRDYIVKILQDVIVNKNGK